MPQPVLCALLEKVRAHSQGLPALCAMMAGWLNCSRGNFAAPCAQSTRAGDTAGAFLFKKFRKACNSRLFKKLHNMYIGIQLADKYADKFNRLN